MWQQPASERDDTTSDLLRASSHRTLAELCPWTPDPGPASQPGPVSGSHPGHTPTPPHHQIPLLWPCLPMFGSPIWAIQSLLPNKHHFCGPVSGSQDNPPTPLPLEPWYRPNSSASSVTLCHEGTRAIQPPASSLALSGGAT